ncbi:MAG: hypothetical protein E7212_11180 [Clostridium sartagoforme]|nr:hypothetical protein [Clostridium sartagoforme]
MKSRLKNFILLICILVDMLIPIKISAEILTPGSFDKLSIDEGLSNEYVTKIFQDSKGYMWIGTGDGLNRFDGERIKIYNCNYDDENSLSSTYINDIEEDDKGNIWIATDNGLDVLVRDTDTILRMKDNELNHYGLGDVNITSLLRSSYEENIMWVGTENGLIKINIEDKTVKAFYHDENDINSLTNSFITALSEGKNGIVWIGTVDGINNIDINSNIVYKKKQVNGNDLYVYNIESGSNGDVWVSSKEGIFVYELREEDNKYIWHVNNNGVKRLDVNGENIIDYYDINSSNEVYNNKSITIDSNDNAWISSSNGILKYSLDSKKTEVLKNDKDFPHSLTSNVITCFYEDSNGVIWVGTDKGVNILNRYSQFNPYKEKDDASNRNIISMVKHDEYLWIATKHSGIYIYNLNGELIHKIYNDDKSIEIRNEQIESLYEINDEWIVIITNKRIISINTKEHYYKIELLDKGYYSEVDYLYSDKENVWIASKDSFYSYNIKSDKKIYYNNELINFNINPGDIKYILQDNSDDNILWLGGVETGIIKFHKKNGIVAKYINEDLDDNFLINNYINCMVFDNSGDIWIGTNIGITKFNIEKNEYTSYTTANGLTNNYINSILVDDYNNLWISTNKGLNKYDREKEKIVNFVKIDGLKGYQFNLNSSIKLQQGIFLFGSTSGLTYFYPEDIITPTARDCKVVIGDIYVGKDKVTYNEEELVLEYNYKNLSIDYFLPDYESLNNITYEYMLEGIDSDWIYIDTKSNLELKALDPGKYILKLRARDGHGELTKETVLNIRVKNPIWKTPLAYIIYVIIVIVIILYILNYVNILHKLVEQKTMKINKQLDENKRLSKEIIDKERFKNNYFINLSHELRTPINVIIATVQLIKSIIKDKPLTYEKSNEYMDVIGRNCETLLKVINDIIDSSKIETGHYEINKENNDIVNIVEEAALTMSKFIEEKGLSLIIDPDIEEKVISCDGTEIERCVINLLSNAVKYTPKGGEIRVFIKEINDNIEITIEDTGIGVAKEDQEFIFNRFSQVKGTGVSKASSSGIGLALVKHIAELHGGFVKLESEINKGSRFTVVLPDIVEDNIV